MAAGRIEHPAWAEAEWQPWAESKLQVSPDVLQWIDGEMMFAYWQKLIPRIICPTLLVTADPALDAVVTPELAQTMVELNPQIRVALISGAGHNIRREQFEGYVEVVRAFLREVY
jgi:pimeloyl-ACP methyl ester carboxylesterase